jgi:putative addiction module component (TIGR02574 family)
MEMYNEILRAALALPYDQRWKLVEEVEETLHPAPNYKTQDEFEATVHQRIADMESGRAKLVEPEEVFRKIRETLDRARGKMPFD